MTAPTPAVQTPGAGRERPPGSVPVTRSLYWSVRRELWEYRSLWMAPSVVAMVALLAFMASVRRLPSQVAALAGPDSAQAHEVIHMPYGAAAMLGFATAFLVGVFYCLEALQGERRDRSILFWKSLPVSDVTTVIAKACIPLIVLPWITLVVFVSVHIGMLLVSTVVLAGDRSAVVLLWAHVQPVQSAVTMLYAVTVIALWHAPIFGWLLLVSAWARRAALPWAVLPLLAIAGVERIVFGSTEFLRMLGRRVVGWVTSAFDFTGHAPDSVDVIDALSPATFVADPRVWLGLAFAAVCIGAATQLRRHREPN